MCLLYDVNYKHCLGLVLRGPYAGSICALFVSVLGGIGFLKIRCKDTKKISNMQILEGNFVIKDQK